jgi:hypothetical protein
MAHQHEILPSPSSMCTQSCLQTLLQRPCKVFHLAVEDLTQSLSLKYSRQHVLHILRRLNFTQKDSRLNTRELSQRRNLPVLNLLERLQRSNLPVFNQWERLSVVRVLVLELWKYLGTGSSRARTPRSTRMSSTRCRSEPGCGTS